jgi:hypothetical protein
LDVLADAELEQLEAFSASSDRSTSGGISSNAANWFASASMRLRRS